jgi:hypothetical protein
MQCFLLLFDLHTCKIIVEFSREHVPILFSIVQYK